ncbi:MAG: LON peptidase substrate-binding domain-containing protein [Rhizobiales bacterium]|nr:LON peptidase substrate-binding domain-containing protein [Hyphomicrobiales bacterium]
MKAGNVSYNSPGDLPKIVPVFPLAGALLLPRAEMPLNIFEPRYLAMVEAAMAGDRIIGMVQPEDRAGNDESPALRAIGCAGRITSFAETGDGRYAITLTGISRFRIVEEVPSDAAFRLCRVTARPYAEDFADERPDSVDRIAVLDTFRAYLEAHNLEADWDTVGEASNEMLVNALAMMAPFAPAEKQALLEAPDLRTRAETLVAITEMSLARDAAAGRTLQ